MKSHVRSCEHADEVGFGLEAAEPERGLRPSGLPTADEAIALPLPPSCGSPAVDSCGTMIRSSWLALKRRGLRLEMAVPPTSCAYGVARSLGSGSVAEDEHGCSWVPRT